MFGVVQGRLSKSPNNQLQWFPQDCWQEEYHKCERLNLDFVELLDERSYNPNNPIWSSSGREEIWRVASETNRVIYSSCTDHIIDNSLLLGSTLDHVLDYFQVSEELGCKIAILPLMEESGVTEKNFDKYVSVVRKLCNSTNLTICLETLLNCKTLNYFIDQVNVKNLKCVFDTGNRSHTSKDLSKEIVFLSDKIGHVHLKDKNKKGENVYLGTGKVNFCNIFKSLKEIGYNESFVFESVRGNDPIKTMEHNIEFINFFRSEVENE
jgi:sugar phosphate isomerase/epimerase